MSVSPFSLLGHTVGEYRVETLLGAGRANAAYQGLHLETKAPVIITILLLPASLTPETLRRFLQRFLHLSETLISLPHNRHLLAVRDFGEHRGLPYLVTEQTDTLSLSLAALLRQQGAASLATSLAVLQQVADALSLAHARGITHGNITPAALLLHGGREVQLVGLGLREMVEAHDLLATSGEHRHLRNLWGTYLGDPRYLAPECVLGQRPDARSDLYALGLLLYELLRGIPAFPGSGKTYLDIAAQHVQDNISFLKEGLPELPSGADELLKRLLARNPADRLQHASDVVQACNALLQGRSPSLGLPTGGERASSTSRTARRLPGVQAESVSLQPTRSTHPTTVSLDQLSNEQVRDLVYEIEAHIWDGYLLPSEERPRRGWNTWMTQLTGGSHVEAA